MVMNYIFTNAKLFLKTKTAAYSGLPQFGRTVTFSASFHYQSLVIGWTVFQFAFVVTI
jgi:hypothetical protein